MPPATNSWGTCARVPQYCDAIVGANITSRVADESASPSYPVVVVGASAGGVDALEAVVATLPEDYPGAVFVVLVPVHHVLPAAAIGPLLATLASSPATPHARAFETPTTSDDTQNGAWQDGDRPGTVLPNASYDAAA